jgi:gliding motility-associated-like protein
MVSVTTTSSSCGASTGTASVTVTNFSGTETYTWSPGGQHTQSINGLAPGTYTCVVGMDCATTTFTTVTATVTGPTIPTVSVTTATVCAGASASITASGASTYTWNTGATTTSISESPTVTTTYTVTGTSASGCTNTATGNITVNNAPAVSATNTTLCTGSTVTLSASGANTYTWSTGATTSTISVSPTVNATYTVTGATAAGCTATAIGTVTVSSLPTITIPNDSICKNSTGTLVASGANTYTWNTSVISPTLTIANVNSSATYTVTGTSAAGCANTAVGNIIVRVPPVLNVPPATICPGSTTTLTASGANTYTWNTGATTSSIVITPTVNTTFSVTGTNINGCVSATATTSVTLSTSSNLTVTASVPIACSNVPFTLTASGASPNTYTWTASSGVSISSNLNQISETQTTSETYTVSGSLGGGCTTSPATITVNVATPATLTITTNPSNAQVCQGNSITLTVAGASSYTWTPSITNGVSFVPASSQTYSVAATDGNGCPTSATQPVTVNPLPNVSASIPSPICPTATATLTASGAVTYIWSTGATGSSISVSPTATLTTYTVTGTDANGCVNTATTVVNVVNNLTILPMATHTLLCAGSIDTLSATGASSYTWTPSVTSISVGTNSLVTTNVAGTYTVIGSSGTCLDSATISITADAPITFSISASPSTSVCPGGTVTLNGISSSTYTYNWSGGITNGTAFTPVTSNIYTVTATDANGCVSAAATQPITVYSVTIINISSTSSSICAGEGSATLTASGLGVTNYTWSTETTGPSTVVTPTINPTTYSVTGIDADGCVANSTVPYSITVNTPAVLTITSGSSGNIVCAGATATLTANNGGTSTYTWSYGTNTSTNNPLMINPTNPTIYSVNGIDANGCKDSSFISITINTSPSIPTVTGNTFICSNIPTILTATDAVNGVNYVWVGPAPSTNTVSTSSTASVTLPGTYIVVATNTCGISSPASQTLIGDTVKASFIEDSLIGVVPVLVSFTNTSVGNSLNYNWHFGNGDTSIAINPNENYTNVGTFQAMLIATDNLGCWDTASVKITVNEVPTIVIIPNIFSPNGDGVNDIFSIRATGISNFDCKIYDRWGLLLYEWTGINGGWNGKGVNGNNSPEGTYFYLIIYTNNQGKIINKDGFFELVR